MRAFARTIDIRVRTRGLYRLENCRFPPLRVNFPEEPRRRNGLRWTERDQAGQPLPGPR